MRGKSGAKKNRSFRSASYRKERIESEIMIGFPLTRLAAIVSKRKLLHLFSPQKLENLVKRGKNVKNSQSQKWPQLARKKVPAKESRPLNRYNLDCNDYHMKNYIFPILKSSSKW